MEQQVKNILIAYKRDKEEVLEDIFPTELGSVVDEGILADIRKKKEEKILKIVKEFLLDYSKLKKDKRHAGSQGVVIIGSTSTSFIDPRDLLEFLIKVDKKKLFMDLVKTNVTDAKKFLGEENIKSILRVEKEEYGSVSFKPMKD